MKDKKFIAVNALGDDRNLVEHGSDPHYLYSIADATRLTLWLRQTYLTEHYTDNRIVRPGEEHASTRENDKKIFVADPYYHQAGSKSFRDYLQSDIEKITATGQYNSIEAGSWSQMPEILVIPILCDGVHWRMVNVRIDYGSKTLNILFDDPYGFGKFPKSLQKSIIDDIRDNAQRLICKQTNDNSIILNINKITYGEKITDQQGSGKNGWDCGPIIFSNVEDYIKHAIDTNNPLIYSIPVYTDNQHQKKISQIRQADIERYKAIDEDETVDLKNNKLYQDKIEKIKYQLEETNKSNKYKFKEIEQDINLSDWVAVNSIAEWPSFLVSIFFDVLDNNRLFQGLDNVGSYTKEELDYAYQFILTECKDLLSYSNKHYNYHSSYNVEKTPVNISKKAQANDNINNKKVTKAISAVNENAGHNPFNQAENYRYKYKDSDIEIIAHNIIKTQGKNLGDYLGITDTLTLNQSQIEFVRKDQDHKLFGIYKNNGHYVSYCISNKQSVITCQYKNSLGKKIEKLEEDLNKAQVDNTLIKVQLFEEGKIDQYTKSSSAIFALKNLSQLLNNVEDFYNPKTLKEINDTRQELSTLYLRSIQENHPKWHESDILAKEKILSTLNPLTQEQFKDATEVMNPQRELSELLNSAIENQNSHLAKLALRAGLIVNNGIEIKNTGNKASFITVLDVEKTKHENSKELEKIGKLLKKYGCSDKITLTVDEIKQKEYSQILQEVALSNNVDIKLYQEFYTLFKSNFEVTITGIQAIGSGKVEQKLSLKHKFVSFFLGKVPIAGSVLSSIYSTTIKMSQKAQDDELKNYLGEKDKFISDYCIRVIKHYGEEIANPSELKGFWEKLVHKITKAINNDSVVKELKKEIRDLDKTLNTKLILDDNQHKKFIHQDKDYTEYWNKLILSYIQSFMEFLFTKEAQDNFINKDSFGAIAAKHLFEFHKVSKEEIENITPEFSKDNVKTFAKLISYISEIPKYPQSIAVSENTYWCDTNDQTNETAINTQSIIIATKDKIIISYNASVEANQIKYSQDIKKIGNIKIPTKLKEDFYKFYDNAQYYSTKDNSIEPKSLGVILEDCLKNYPKAKIYLSGDKFGGVMASMIYLHLTSYPELYNVKPDQVSLYTYGELPWCHQDSVGKAKILFKNYYQVVASDDNVPEHLMGEKYYLKAGHLLSEMEYKKVLELDKSEVRKKVCAIKDYVEELERQDKGVEKKLGQFGEENTIIKSKLNQEKVDLGISYFWKRIEKAANRSELFKAIIEQDIKKVEKELLIEDVNRVIEGITPLHAAAYVGHFEIFKSLVDHEADINVRVDGGNHAGAMVLHLTAYMGHFDIVKYLVEEKNVNVNNVDGDTGTVLHCALDYNSKKDNYEIVKLLVEKGADLEGKTDYSADNKNLTPLCFAVKYNHGLKIVQYLVENGANINIKTTGSFYKHTLLHYAAEAGDLEVMKYLSVRGLDVNYKDTVFLYGNTPLTEAARCGYFDIVKYLVEEKNAEINTRSWMWNNPLSEALYRQRYDIAKYLIKKGANVNFTDYINEAIRHGNFEMVKCLAESGAKLNMRDSDKFDIARPFNGSTVYKKTPLHYAADNGTYYSGFDTDYICEAKKNLHIFKYLVEKGADLYLLDKEQQTPLDYLLTNKDQPDILQYLTILKLQSKIQNESLTFDIYQQNMEKLLSKGCNLYSLSTYFVSECIRIRDKFDLNLSKPLKPKEKIKLELAQNKFIKEQKQYFEGDYKIQIYNQAIKLLLTYSNPQRFVEALKICDKFLNSFYDDQDFLFLKGIIYITQAGGDISSEKAEYFYSKVVEVLEQLEESSQSLYLQGELNYAHGFYEEAGSCYERATKLDPHFNHPKVRMAIIYTEQGKLGKLKTENAYFIWEKDDLYKAKQLVSFLDKKILSIDLEPIIQDMQETFDTKDFMNIQSAKELAQQDFDSTLKEAFVVDVLRTKTKLQEAMPNKLRNKDLTSTNKELFNAYNLLDKIDYGYDLMAKFFGGKIFGQKDFVPEYKTHPFFEKINTLTSKLASFKKAVIDQCDSISFKGKKVTKDQYINLIDDILNYYDNYIMRIVKDYQYSQDPNYLKRFNSGKGKDLDVKKSISVYTERKLDEYQENEQSNKIKIHAVEPPYLLKRDASSELTISEPKSEYKYGTHKIVVWPPEGDNQVYYKYYPYAPGIEFAVSSLYGQILPNSTPETMLVKLTDGKYKAIYLASKAVTGRNFAEVMNQPEILQTIEMQNFSGLFISSFLVCTGDAKPDNFVLHFNYDSRGLKSTHLISVDNDIAFCREKLKIFTDNKNHQKKLYSDMLNILYLMPQMNDLVSPHLREYLLRPEKQPEIIIASWLGKLHQKNESYNKLLGFDKVDLEQMKLPIKLPIGTATKVYSNLTKIMKLLSSEVITHNDIFKSLSPSLAYFYKKYRDNTSIVNSLKNLYVESGADPLIVSSLYSTDKIISSKAWNTMSASKRKDPRVFKEIFKSEIMQEAEEFIATIDFTNKDDLVILSIKQNLNFVRQLELHKINTHQLEMLLADNNFKNPSKVKIIDGRMSLEQQENLAKKYEKLYKITGTLPDNNPIENLIPSKEILVLDIESIWDLIDSVKRPSDEDLINKRINDRLMQTMKEKNIDINEQDEQGNTVLHKAVLADDLVIIKLLLDCGIDKNLKNHAGQKAIDLGEKHPEIIMLILEHQPLYFQQLIKQERVEEAEIIAESIHISSLTELLEGILVGQESSILQAIMANRKFKPLVHIALTKLKKISTDNLLHLFATNYTDDDLDILQLLLNEPSLLKSKDNTGMFAADIALINKQYNMLCMLLNNGSMLTPIDDNTNLIIKAANHGIKIDPSDFKTNFNYEKTDNNGNTIFHLMCKNKDLDIFNYQDLLKKYQNVKNKENNDLGDLAIAEDFVELLELLYPDQGQLYDKDGYHKFAKDEHTQELSKFLKKHGVDITIEEARFGINLHSKIDQKGNTVLQQLIKKYILFHEKEILQDIDNIIKYSTYKESDYVNYTVRSDGNTALHLATIAGNKEIVDKLFKSPNLNPLVRNGQKQTALDLAKKFFSHSDDLVRNLKIITENYTKQDYDKKLLEIIKLENKLLDTNFANVGDFILDNKNINNHIFENLLDEVMLTGEY
ncbi:MAG: ankyrin repeat domain-containing protein [Rickettsiaceae bacterium]|nr:ankyrin repeat domain-containing protein [Rickettsiaceae bacterium]